MNRREFYVETPMGKLKVYAKHPEGDCEQDYPGIFVDLVREGSVDEFVACIEYDSNMGGILTTVYEFGDDCPSVYIRIDENGSLVEE